MPKQIDSVTPLPPPAPPRPPVPRLGSGALLQGGRELEITHAGKIYRLRVTQLNKLILTA